MKKRSVLFLVSLPIAAISLIFLLLSRKNSLFASIINASVGARLRSALLSVSNSVPFSLFELLIVFSPAAFVLLIYSFRNKGKAALRRRFLSVIGVFLLIFSIFINTLVIGYGVDIKVQEMSVGKTELSLTLEYLSEKINSLDNITYPDSELLSKKLFDSYKSLDFPQLSLTKVQPKFKKIKSSGLASRLGILGSYSFLTSEINVNLSAPAYTVPFSAAHEMAHLFGISGEAEASFLAYCASVESKDTGIMYSAYLSAFEYVGGELLYQNRDLYFEKFSSLSEKAKSDIAEYRRFYIDNHSDITDSSNKINGELLDFVDKNGDTAYSAFTYLLVSHLISENAL